MTIFFVDHHIDLKSGAILDLSSHLNDDVAVSNRSI